MLASLARKIGANGVNHAADGDNGLDVLIDKFVEMLGVMMTYIDADFLHHPHGKWMHMARRNATGTLHVEQIASGSTQNTLSHMAATTIPGTEYQYGGLRFRHAQGSNNDANLSIPPL